MGHDTAGACLPVSRELFHNFPAGRPGPRRLPVTQRPSPRLDCRRHRASGRRTERPLIHHMPEAVQDAPSAPPVPACYDALRQAYTERSRSSAARKRSSQSPRGMA